MYIHTVNGSIINTAHMLCLRISENKNAKFVNGEWQPEYSIVACMHMAPDAHIVAYPTKEEADDMLNSIWGGLQAGCNTFNVPRVRSEESRLL